MDFFDDIDEIIKSDENNKENKEENKEDDKRLNNRENSKKKNTNEINNKEEVKDTSYSEKHSEKNYERNSKYNYGSNPESNSENNSENNSGDSKSNEKASLTNKDRELINKSKSDTNSKKEGNHNDETEANDDNQSKKTDAIKKIDTIVIKINPENFKASDLERPATIIKEGGLVAFPTETVYGLGASALNAYAVSKIFVAKGRPQDNPLIVHISNMEMLYDLVMEVPPVAKQFIRKFWPGPLTLIFKKNYKIPSVVTAGLDTVAIRMPSHPIAKELIRQSYPIAAPSANLSGKPSPTRAEHVIHDLFGRVDCIIDGGESYVGLESTVVDITHDTPMLLRPGGITLEDLRKVNKHTQVHPSIMSLVDIKRPSSPGMKYKHYAPKAQIIIINSDNKKKIIETTRQLIHQYVGLSKKIGIFTNLKFDNDNCVIIRYKKPRDAAHLLFAALREFDRENVDVIITQGIKSKGIGLAVMNRLTKAAGYNIMNL